MSENEKSAAQKVYPFLAALKGPDDSNVVQIYRDRGGQKNAEQVGIFLVDLARHYSRMFAQIGVAHSEDEALNDIRRLFDIEWDSPTDLGEGRIPN